MDFGRGGACAERDQMIEDDSGNPVLRHLRAGDMVCIPQGVFHSTVNTTWEPLRILAIYWPGGPEAFLRSCRTAPACRPASCPSARLSL